MTETPGNGTGQLHVHGIPGQSKPDRDDDSADNTSAWLPCESNMEGYLAAKSQGSRVYIQ